MSTTVAAARPFYTRAWLFFLLAMAVIVAGFVPSFFTKLDTTDIWHHIHGMSATAWLALLVVQPFLYSRGMIAVHRRLGKISYVLVPMLTIGGIKMIALMIQSRAAYPPLESFRLSFIDTVSLAFFILFFTMAIRHVRTTGLHARYLASTVVLLVPPGLARLLFNLFPGIITGFTINLHVCFTLLDLTVALLLWDDWRRDARLSRPYLQLAAVVLFLHLCIPSVASWQWWQQLTLRVFDK